MMAHSNVPISAESVCFIIARSRGFDVADIGTDAHSGTNATDKAMTTVPEAHSEDMTQKELRAFINALREDEQADLVALVWLGRGDGTLEDWADLRDEAQREHSNRTAADLLTEPLLSDHLEEGLSQFGFTCVDFEIDRLVTQGY